MDISSLVNLLAASISSRVSMTLSQQLQQAQRYGAPTEATSWLQRMLRSTGLSPAVPWSERFNLGQPSPANRSRLEKSGRAWSAALQNKADAQRNRDAAVAAYDEEQQNPTGKNLADLQIAIIDYEEALKKASKQLDETTKAHEKVKSEVSRQTGWQTDRTRGNLWSPSQAVKKAQQHWRILKRQWGRYKGAGQAAKRAREAYDAAKATHATNLSKLVAARKAGKGTRAALAAAKTSRTGVKAAGAAMQAANATAMAARAGMLARAGGAVARGGPYVAAAAAVAAMVAYQVMRVKGWVDNQLQKSEQLINTQIQQRSQFNAQIAGAMARYQQQEYQLNMRTAARTASTSEGVVRATMRLKEARQPFVERWENIGNRIQAAAADTATYVLRVWDAVDGVTPMVEKLVGLLEMLPWVKEIADKLAAEKNPGMESVRSMFMANRDNQQQKAFPPVPKIK